MAMSLFPLLAIALYLAGAVWLWRDLADSGGNGARGRRVLYGPGLAAVALHAAVLATGLWRDGALNLGLTPALSLVAWAVTALFLLAALARPVGLLGIFIFPIAAAALAAAWLWPLEHLLPVRGSVLRPAHIVISLLAYSLLSIALLQGLILAWQERWLRGRPERGLLDALPPLETMEALMFQTLTAGFVLLTLTLVTGVFFAEQVFGQPLKLTHHILLSIVSWVVFAVLLAGHWRFGWRGRPALRWALAGFVLLLLAYFGSKFVLEVVLGRS
jgi:ABC-type uncharacterized transport system permease subunit